MAFSLACVASVSVWFRSKERPIDRGTGFSVLAAQEMKQEPKNDESSSSFTYAIFRAVFDSRSTFFAPKPHGNACYAGYVFSDECSTFLDLMNDIGIDKKQQLYIIKKMINMAIRATYYIFCCRNRNWDSPDLMQFSFLFFSFLFFFLLLLLFFFFVLFCSVLFCFSE